jgi:hypothetical protein
LNNISDQKGGAWQMVKLNNNPDPLTFVVAFALLNAARGLDEPLNPS